MANIKKRLLVLSTGRKIKLTGIGIFISPDLEVGEGFTNNLFCPLAGKGDVVVSNPYKLSPAELHEIADLIIKTAVQFKDYVDEKLIQRDTAAG